MLHVPKETEKDFLSGNLGNFLNEEAVRKALLIPGFTSLSFITAKS